MRIAVTGSSKLAGAIIDRFDADSYRVEDRIEKSDYDVFINNAHVGFQQTLLLEEWCHAWYEDSSKLIINISSRAGLPNLSKGYMYAAQKASLDHIADNITYNSHKKCRITTINLGMLEDSLPSVTYSEVCDLIQYVLSLPKHLEIPRIFLQNAANYKEVQKLKSSRY
jgi:short-subunit dehydrogenase